MATGKDNHKRGDAVQLEASLSYDHPVFGGCDLKNKKWHKFYLAPGPGFVCLFVCPSPLWCWVPCPSTGQHSLLH